MAQAFIEALPVNTHGIQTKGLLSIPPFVIKLDRSLGIEPAAPIGMTAKGFYLPLGIVVQLY